MSLWNDVVGSWHAGTLEDVVRSWHAGALEDVVSWHAGALEDMVSNRWEEPRRAWRAVSTKVRCVGGLGGNCSGEVNRVEE